MIKYVLTSLLLLSVVCTYSQTKIEWSEDYTLKAEDFKATAPNASNTQTIFPNVIIEFKYANYQLAFSNLNSNVGCSFLPLSSWLDEGVSKQQLLDYAQVSWDLHELAARKLRKAFRENRMKLSQSKMTELHQQVMAEITEIQSQYARETEFGTIPDQQALWKIKVQDMLDAYGAYCKTCKPPKKRKKKKS